MRIAVVGARGQLGAALVHECAGAHETTAFGRDELDISDTAAVADAMARVRPEVIFNAAAFTNVDPPLAPLYFNPMFRA
jgi:dTDP-4-dehydrorhamnose reductase